MTGCDNVQDQRRKTKLKGNEYLRGVDIWLVETILNFKWYEVYWNNTTLKHKPTHDIVYN